MRYTASETGQYKSALRAESLYSIVEIFLQSIPHSEIEAGIRSTAGPRNVWNREHMKRELQEFVVSYLVGSFRNHMPELEGILLAQEAEKKLDDYCIEVRERFGPNYRGAVDFSRRQFNRNQHRLRREIQKINRLEDRNESIKIVAHDMFGHFYTAYAGQLYLFFERLKIKMKLSRFHFIPSVVSGLVGLFLMPLRHSLLRRRILGT